MDVELQATCSSLGFHEGKEYIKEPDALETVKDLIRFLRRDTDTCDIRRQLGHAQILQNDLIPMVIFYHEDKTLFETVIKLIVNLTQPVLTCFNNEIPDEKTLRNNCLEVEGYLQDYKEAFINEDLFNVLAGKIQDILKLDWDDRREEDKLQLERLFVLVRNVLMIPPNYDREKRTEDDASTHDQILWTLHTTGVEDLVLYVASSDRERNMLCMHVLEIIFLMFKEQEVETIVSAGVQRSATEKEKDQKELEHAREKEKAQRKASILKFSARHSRFGGTYVIKNMKSISEGDVIYHKPLCEVETFSLDTGKSRKKISKNRAPIKTDSTKRRSTLSMRLSLQEFCVQFLVNAYNPLMRAVKDALTRKTTQDNDETYYLWTMRFFMQFCRLHCKRVDLVSETMSLPSFHYIYTQLCTYYENIRLEKGEVCKLWGRRAHLALKAYQELLHTLDFMYRSEDEKIKESAKVIQSNVFYMMEYRDVFVTLLKNFQEGKSSRAYLRDLVESTHIFLKMLERFMKTSRHLVVQKKGKKKRKKKTGPVAGSGPTEEDLAATWGQQISSELLAVLENCPESDSAVVPFDAASDMSIDEQRVMAMLRIQSCLRDRNLVEAVSLFHAAREVWPERDEFGSENMSVEEELNALQEIFMANLHSLQLPSQHNTGQEEGEDEINEIEEEEIEETQTCETELNFNAFITDFAHPEVIKKYAILLEEFPTNSDNINHCIIKMLHRLSHDLGYVGMLFQASIFKTFNTLLQEHYCRLKRYQEMTKFACYVVRQFTSVAATNTKVFVDLMFWKSKTEALAITSDYKFQQKCKGKQLWTEHEEQELKSLFEKYKDVDHPDLDLMDLIKSEITTNHTRLQLLRELKRQGLINSARDIKRKGPRPPKWTEEEVEKVIEAFNMHRASDYPIAEIMKALNTSKSKRLVIAKIIELGMVQDKKELLKQRSSKRGGSGKQVDVDSGDEDRLFGETGRRGKPNKSRRRKGSDDSEEDDDSDGDVDSDEDDDNDYHEDESDGDNIPEAGHQSVGRVTAAAINDSINSLKGKGYHRQLTWIVRCLRNAAEDRSDGAYVPTPIVPLTEENETAMDDEMFLIFLRSIGFSPPANEQEMFWRIPANYSESDLSKIAECLELAEGEGIHEVMLRVFPASATSVTPSSKHKKTSDVTKTSVTPSSKHEKKAKKREQTNDVTRNSATASNKPEKKTRREKTSDVTKRKEPKSKRKSLKDTLLGIKDNKNRLSQDNSVNMDIALNSCSEEEHEREDMLIPNISVLSKTSDVESSSGLEEAEAEEQVTGLERGGTSNRKLKAANRRQALNQMVQARNVKKTSSRAKKQDAISNIGKTVDKDSHPSHAKDSRPLLAQLINGASQNGINSLNTQSDSPSPSREMPGTADLAAKPKRDKSSQQVTAGVKKRFLDSDSDSDVNHAKVIQINEDHSGSHSAHTTKRLRFLSSDDDSDADDSVNHGNASQNELYESLRLHFSDGEDGTAASGDRVQQDPSGQEVVQKDSSAKQAVDSFPATLFSQDLSSDEEDDHIPLRTAVRKRKLVIDESDEDH
ncbi:hypothetical protein BsWGS_25604 [Bradybaena similaris]